MRYGKQIKLSCTNAIMNAHGGKLQCGVQEDLLTISAFFPA